MRKRLKTTVAAMVLRTRLKITIHAVLKLVLCFPALRFFLGILILAGGLAPGLGQAEYTGQRFYRYVNDAGETVIATQVPTKEAKRGYEIITVTGRVLEVVDPELRSDARQAQQLQEHIALQKQVKARHQDEADQELLRLFASVEDVDRSLERLLEEIDTRIVVINGNISRLQLQFEQRQARAAQIERFGRIVPAPLVKEMSDIQDGIERFNADIASFEKEKEELKEDYATKKDRVTYLLEGGKKRTRNRALVLNADDIPGEWQPAQVGSGVISWIAESDGRFVLIKKEGRSVEKWRGKWTLSRDNEIVVIYFRKEVTLAGKTSKSAFAKEERYPVMDTKDSDLYVNWNDNIVRFHKVP